MPEIALLIETSTSWGMDLVKGVGAYALAQPDWLLDVLPRGKYEPCRLPAHQPCEGVIARITGDEDLAYFESLGVPVVNVASYLHTSAHVQTCTTDDYLTGQMAAEYYLGRGFDQFAYITSSRPRQGYTDLMKRGFAERLAQDGCTAQDPFDDGAVRAGLPWPLQRDSMARWLADRRGPLAVFVWDDTRGRQITEACRVVGLDVPKDVAVLSTGADEVTNTLSDPLLSSIMLDGQRCGRRAAQLLHDMLRGKPPEEPVLIRPSNVITQQSTDHYASQDTLVNAALRTIHEHACKGLNVEQLVKRLPCSRRTFETRFQQATGSTPAREIRRVQLDRGRQLLEETGKSIADISRLAGFRSPEVFTKNFAVQFDCTPSAYRQRYTRLAGD
ncbi:MAG: substrate-binding domain-containing protein [Phycisphaerales bacterium JB063]